MNAERPSPYSNEFPVFANNSWGDELAALCYFTGYTNKSQIPKVAEHLTGLPLRLGDRFSSHYLPDELYQFIAPELALSEVEFNVWKFADEQGEVSERIGFRTQMDDIIRLAYCEYRHSQPEQVGLLFSWVDPRTEESVFRDVSIFPGNQLVDRRATVYKSGEVELPVIWYGDPHMHIERLPKFRQVDAIYDRHPENGMELAYARQAVFDANEQTYEAHEYSFDIDERAIEYYSLVGEKELVVFTQEIDDMFPPDDSLDAVTINVW